jgi:hypothetical protein
VWCDCSGRDSDSRQVRRDSDFSPRLRDGDCLDCSGGESDSSRRSSHLSRSLLSLVTEDVSKTKRDRQQLHRHRQLKGMLG